MFPSTPPPAVLSRRLLAFLPVLAFASFSPILAADPTPITTVLIDEDFSEGLTNWLDLSTAVTWTGSPANGSVFQFTDGVLNLNNESRTANMWNNPGGIRSFSAIDYVFPAAVSHRTNTITIEFRLRWASITRTGENSRVAFKLIHDYPESGMDLTPEAKVMDFSQAWWGRPAYQVRIRGGFNPSDAASYFMYGGGHDINGTFETAGNPSYWLPGFVSGPGGATPGTSPSQNFPINGWYMGTTAPASTTFKGYRYIVTPNSQQLWVNHNDDGVTWTFDMEMPLPFEEDAPETAPLYRYFENFEGLRIYFRSPGAGSSAPNAFLGSVKITVVGDYDPSAEPQDLYADWAQLAFGTDYGNPATEATLWGREANPAKDGLSNAIKAGMGLSPLNRAPQHLLKLTVSEDEYIFPFSIHPDLSADNWAVITSTDAGDDADYESSWAKISPNNIHLIETTADTIFYEARIPRSSEPFFIRLRLEP